MWGLLFESFAEAFGVTRRTRPLVLLLVVSAAGSLTALTFAEGGPRGIIALVTILVLGWWSSSQVLAARHALWQAARRTLDDPAQAPRSSGDDRDLAPTATTLNRLAQAIDEARRGSFLDASHTLTKVDRRRLRPDEERLLEATRAMVSLGLGEPDRAALQAVRALPTTSDEIDLQLGRTVVAELWNDPARLRALDETWAERGVPTGMKLPLPRLRAIVKLRIGRDGLDALESWEAKTLADEARAIGDENMASDLEARIRPAAYR